MVAKSEMQGNDGFGASLAFPSFNHILTYTSLPALKPVPVAGTSATVPSSTVARINAGRKAALASVPADSGLVSSLGLSQTVALTGEPNNPATPADANNPGLDNEDEGKGIPTMKKYWILAVLILAVILGLLWYYNPGNILAR
jgi:hypothetical protein